MDADTSIWVAWAARQGFGWTNPNYAAALFVNLALLVWLGVFVNRKAFWFCLPVSLLFSVLLVFTQSRGGMAGFLVGAAIVIPFIRGKTRKIILIATHLLVLGVASLWLTKTGNRIEKGFSGNDGSINNRLIIWEQTPAMMVQSPQGWGFGNSADAYHQWYQPIGQDYRYKHLINSHLTLLVESGWIERLLYISFWLACLLLCLPSASMPGLAVLFAVWVAFGTTSFFSGVALQWYEWIVPVLALAGAVWMRCRSQIWPALYLWSAVVIASTFVLLVFYTYGKMHEVQNIGGNSARVWAGESKNPLVILRPAEKILGEKYGHRIRENLASDKETAVVVYRQISNSIPSGGVLVLSGSLEAEDVAFIAESKPKGLVLINPIIKSEVTSDLPHVPTVVLWGELRPRSDQAFWESWAGSDPLRKFEIVEGSAEYIPSWFTRTKQAFDSMPPSP